MKQSFYPSPILPAQCHWQPLGRQPLPPVIGDWIADSGSLTRRLRQHGRFAVQPLRQMITRPTATELRLAGQRPRQHALVREVLLTLDGEPVVFARSILPLRSLHGANRVLGHMARRSLGLELFKPPKATRRAVWVTCLDGARLPVPGLQGPVWGRESLFVKRGQPCLVAEFFLPALWARADIAGGTPSHHRR